MLLTKDGVYALADFTIRAAPANDEDPDRDAGHDGILLECVHPHDGARWRKQWAIHVAPPSLRDLVLVAGQHWERAHRPPEAEGTKAGATA